MNDSSNNKKSTQPAEVVDTWARLVMFHQRVKQMDVANALGVSNATLHNWLKGSSSPDPLVLLRLMAHGREAWQKLMAFQCLQAICPEVFVDVDLCGMAVDVHKLAELPMEDVITGGSESEVPWS